MALKVYIGARYTPKFEGEWKANKEYAALSVVYYNNKSYVSRKTVPTGTAVTETEFWVESADWNAQVEQYNQNVAQYKTQVDTYQSSVERYTEQVNQFYADTLHSYETRDEMIADTNIKLGDTLLTCGKDAIGDGGGSFYQVVNTQSQKTVVLANGLYAEPFEFQPYDYAAFEQKVDEYKAEVDQQLDEVEQYSLRNYDTTNKMVADRSLMTGNTVLTSGENSVGDGQGSFWKVVDQAGSDTTALANGKYAKPFQLNPYEVSNRVTDNLNPDFRTGIPPCVWSGTIHGNGINIVLGTLPAHKQVDGSWKVDSTIFINASFETTNERSSSFSIIHGGYNGLPALTYRFNVSGANSSSNIIKSELIAVRLTCTYNDNSYTSATGANSVVTSWNSAESNIDFNAPEKVTTVVTATDSSGELIKWTGLPRTNIFFYPITAKKDGYTLSALRFIAGANVTNPDDNLWTINISKYNSAEVLHTANFYAVNGSDVEYNVAVGFALAKGQTYKLTFSGPESAKMNFSTVSADQINENPNIDVKTAPGYWQDNNTVVMAAEVTLNDVIVPTVSGYYTTSKNITEWPSEGYADMLLAFFKANNDCTLKKIDMQVHASALDHAGNAYFRIVDSTTNNILYTSPTTSYNANTPITLDLNQTNINIVLTKGHNYYVEPDGAAHNWYRFTSSAQYGDIVTGKDIEGITAIPANDSVLPLVARVETSKVEPTPGETVVMYGDAGKKTNWDMGPVRITSSKHFVTYITLKKNVFSFTYEFTTTLYSYTTSSPTNYLMTLTDSDGKQLWSKQYSMTNTGAVDVKISAQNVKAGNLTLTIAPGDSSAATMFELKVSSSSTVITNNEYIDAFPHHLDGRPMVGKYTLTLNA